MPVLALAAAVAGAWYGAALARQGGVFLDVVLRENVLRFVDTEAAGTGHGHPAAYLVLLGLVGLLPWTPLLPLALVPFRSRPAPAVAALGAWTITILVFFSLAAAKRSVYLLPLFPAVALLLGAGVASMAEEGRAPAAARAASWTYLPAALALAAIELALACGIDASAPVRPWLRPDDAAGAAALAVSGRAAAAPLAALALATVAGAAVLARARTRDDWRRVVIVVAALAVASTAIFDGFLHPAVARTRSLAEFMARVDRLVPPDSPLYAMFPPDPGLRFYAPRELRRWPPENRTAPSYVLLWEDERQRALDRSRSIVELATSEARQAGRGRLGLAMVPTRQHLAAGW
jgi:4-amino-4-deoxy-L-arabinose transferase-like glycosyltransferase